MHWTCFDHLMSSVTRFTESLHVFLLLTRQVPGVCMISFSFITRAMVVSVNALWRGHVWNYCAQETSKLDSNYCWELLWNFYSTSHHEPTENCEETIENIEWYWSYWTRVRSISWNIGRVLVFASLWTKLKVKPIDQHFLIQNKKAVVLTSYKASILR